MRSFPAIDESKFVSRDVLRLLITTENNFDPPLSLEIQTKITYKVMQQEFWDILGYDFIHTVEDKIISLPMKSQLFFKYFPRDV